MKTKPLVVTSLMVALSFVLNLIPLIKMPQGGTASLCSTLFLMLPAFIYGRKYGILACVSAGMISFIMDPWFLSPIQFLLDYIFAKCAWSFGAFIFSNKSKFALHKYYIIGLIFSIFFGILSGVVFFADYAPEGVSPLVYSATYNSYQLVEGAIVLLLLSVPLFRNAVMRETQKATQ